MNPRIIDRIAEDAAELYRRLHDKLPLAGLKERREAAVEMTARAMPAIVEANTK